MTFDMMTCFTIVLALMAIGEMVSKLTGAKIPSVFITAILFLFGFWTIFPADLVKRSVLGMPLAQVSMYVLVVHMGTLFNFRELRSEWRTALISLAGVAGIIVALLVVGRLFLDWDFLVTSAPPLTGGLVAAIIMSEEAAKRGLEALSILAILLYVMQGFVGYPVTAIALAKESERLLKKWRSGEGVMVRADESKEGKKLIRFPSFCNSVPFYLCKIGVVVILAIYSEKLTGGLLSKYVFCLIYGTIAAELGFLESKILDRTQSFGIFMVSLMIFVFSTLSKATPDMLLSIALPLVIVLALATMGLALLSMLVGRWLGYSKAMSVALAITAFYGFPANFILAEEAANANGKTKEEVEYLRQEMEPKMIIGGFVSVTIVSVIVAGVLSKLL